MFDKDILGRISEKELSILSTNAFYLSSKSKVIWLKNHERGNNLENIWLMNIVEYYWLILLMNMLDILLMNKKIARY